MTPFAGNQLAADGVTLLDARTMFFFVATGITPAMATKILGAGSQYGVAFSDSRDRPLDGRKPYRLRLPPGIPARQFWSVSAYDVQTRSLVLTDPRFPGVSSRRKGLVLNQDASVDLYFGAKPPPGKGKNWIQTLPGKGWFAVLRLHGPTEAWFDKSWRPGEIEELGA